jgi:hypothetical protein
MMRGIVYISWVLEWALQRTACQHPKNWLGLLASFSTFDKQKNRRSRLRAVKGIGADGLRARMTVKRAFAQKLGAEARIGRNSKCAVSSPKILR